MPSAEEGLRLGVGIGAEELADDLVVGLVEKGRCDDGETSESGGGREVEVEEDDGEKEGEDDGDGEGESLGDIVGVLNGESCSEEKEGQLSFSDVRQDSNSPMRSPPTVCRPITNHTMEWKPSKKP